MATARTSTVASNDRSTTASSSWLIASAGARRRQRPVADPHRARATRVSTRCRAAARRPTIDTDRAQQRRRQSEHRERRLRLSDQRTADQQRRAHAERHRHESDHRRDLHRRQSRQRIRAIADRTARQRRNAEVVADRERRKRNRRDASIRKLACRRSAAPARRRASTAHSSADGQRRPRVRIDAVRQLPPMVEHVGERDVMDAVSKHEHRHDEHDDGCSGTDDGLQPMRPVLQRAGVCHELLRVRGTGGIARSAQDTQVIGSVASR